MQASAAAVRPKVLPCNAYNKTRCTNEECPYSHTANLFSLSSGGRNVCILFLMNRCDGYGCLYSHSREDIEWTNEDIESAIHEHIQVIDAYIGRMSRMPLSVPYTLPPVFPIAMHQPSLAPWSNQASADAMYPTPINTEFSMSPYGQQIVQETAESESMANSILREPDISVEGDAVEQTTAMTPAEDIEPGVEENGGQIDPEEPDSEALQPTSEIPPRQWNLDAPEFIPPNFEPIEVSQQENHVEAAELEDDKDVPVVEEVVETIVIKKKEKPKSATSADIMGWYTGDSEEQWGWDPPADTGGGWGVSGEDGPVDYKESEVHDKPDGAQNEGWDSAPALDAWGAPAETVSQEPQQTVSNNPPPKKFEKKSQKKDKLADKGGNKASAKTKAGSEKQKTKAPSTKEKKKQQPSKKPGNQTALKSAKPLLTVVEESGVPSHREHEQPAHLTTSIEEPEEEIRVPIRHGFVAPSAEKLAEIKKATRELKRDNKAAKAQKYPVTQQDDGFDLGMQWVNGGTDSWGPTPDPPREFAERSSQISPTTSWVAGSRSRRKWPKLGET